MKILTVIIILLLLGNTTFSQVSKIGVNFTRTFADKDFDLDKVYFKDSGLKISKEEFFKITRENPRMYYEREVDEEGNVVRYIYDPANQTPRTTGNIKAMVSENGEFPNFKFTTIDKKRIELKNLRGKLVLLRFELEANSFRFKKQEIEELDQKINELNNKEDVEAIIIFQCSEEEVRQGFTFKNSNFDLVANGQNFIFKYDIHHFPSTVLIDQNGKLIENYSFPDDINFSEHLNN